MKTTSRFQVGVAGLVLAATGTGAGTAAASVTAYAAAGVGQSSVGRSARAAQAAPIPGVDSMWVWQARPSADLAAQASELGVGRVFLFVPSAAGEGDGNLQQSVRLLHDEGVRVYALSGEPAWTFRHRAAVAWARRALRLAPFDGLHLDVEPHALRHWKRDQQRLIADYLALLDRIAPMAGPLGVDVQFAYGKIATPGGSTFADDILGRVDEVTVMSYRDTGFGNNSLTEIATDWLQRASAAGTDVWLAAETNAVPGCSYCTFYEDGQGRMHDVLAAVDEWARPQFPTYRGMAIEDLDGWLALGP